MSSIFNMPLTQAFDGAGNTLAGAKLYFYEAGTSTLQNVYADAELTTALSNPVVADGGGRFVPIYLADNEYKIALYTADNVLVWTADNVIGSTEEESGQYANTAVRSVITAAGNLDASDPNILSYAVFKYANAATFYTDTGTVENNYILSPVGGYDANYDFPYFAGYKIQFVCRRTNTDSHGSVLVDVNGHGIKHIRRWDGSDLRPGDMYGLVTLIYNGIVFLLVDDIDKFNIGDIKSSVQTANHGNWLLCNGQAVSREDYAELFELIGTSFGGGDGINTFNVPDYRGKFLRGLGGNSAADIYTTQAEGLPNITGTTGANGNGGTTGYNTAGAFYEADKASQAASDATIRKCLYFDASRSNAIYGASEHVTPINQAVNYFIKAR